ncbi:MAG: PadR family transcriptional regulator [Thaumarchaeota archaeon]|nr:PadR family transcriptional regulator [Nitrososphaerota archaeon]
MQAGRTRFSILKLLQERDLHGYEIMREIRKRSAGLLSPSAGTIYPILIELERHRHVSSKWEKSAGRRKRKTYHLTAKGSKTVLGIESLRKRMEQGVAEGLEEGARMLEIEPSEIPKIGDRRMGPWFPLLAEVKDAELKKEMLVKARERLHERIEFMREREKAISKAIESLS